MPGHTAKTHDDLGCPLAKLATDQSFATETIAFHSKGSKSTALGQVASPASNRGFLIGLSTTSGHKRTVFSGNRRIEQQYERNSVYVRNFQDDYKADISGNFDFRLMEIDPINLSRIAEASDFVPTADLKIGIFEKDEVLAGLLSALFSADADSSDGNRLFIDQLSTAIGTHLLKQFGDGGRSTSLRTERLSQSQIQRITELLADDLTRSLTVEELARACKLSPAVFLKAFRDSTGKTPNQWQQSYRIEKAAGLLRHPGSNLREIAAECGFSDQSHFTRVFTRKMGMAPGQWRRRQA